MHKALKALVVALLSVTVGLGPAAADHARSPDMRTGSMRYFFEGDRCDRDCHFWPGQQGLFTGRIDRRLNGTQLHIEWKRPGQTQWHRLRKPDRRMDKGGFYRWGSSSTTDVFDGRWSVRFIAGDGCGGKFLIRARSPERSHWQRDVYTTPVHIVPCH